MFALVIGAVACRPDLPAEDQAFLDLTSEQQEAAIVTHPAERQVELLLLSLRYQHPVHLGLTSQVARSGSRVRDPLLAALSSSKHDWEKTDMLLVFAEMSRLGTYRVHADAQLMSALERVAREVREPPWSGLAATYLADIRAGN